MTWEQVIFRSLMAVVIGGLIGTERARHGRAAGMRTHILVCLGAMLTAMLGVHATSFFGAGDVTRISAQVVSGVGFLGAGTIMVTGLQKVKGLTTAAGLWVVACIGLAFGTGFYVGGLTATILCILAQTLLHTFENRINSRNKLISVFVEFEDMSCIGSFLAFLRKNDMALEELDIGKARTGNSHVGAMIMLKIAKRGEHSRILEILSQAEGVCYVEEIQH